MSKDKVGLLNMELSMDLKEGFELEVLCTQVFKNLLDVIGKEEELAKMLERINDEIQNFLKEIDNEVDKISDCVMSELEELIDEHSK